MGRFFQHNSGSREPLMPAMKPRGPVAEKPKKTRRRSVPAVPVVKPPEPPPEVERSGRRTARSDEPPLVINCGVTELAEPAVVPPLQIIVPGTEWQYEDSPEDVDEAKPSQTQLKDSTHHKRNRRHLLQLQKESTRKLKEEAAKHAARARARETLANKTGLTRVQSRFMEQKDQTQYKLEKREKVRQARLDAKKGEEGAQDSAVPSREQLLERRERAEALQKKQQQHLEAIAARRAAAKEADEAKERKKEMMLQLARDQVLRLRQRNMNVMSGLGEDFQENAEEAPDSAAVGGSGVRAAMHLSHKAIDVYVKKRRLTQNEGAHHSSTSLGFERDRILRLRRLPADTKFFIIQPATSYEDVRQGLMAKGWVENADSESGVFDLKWSLRRADIDFHNIDVGQVVNHFNNNAALTTKVGLARNLRELHWSHDVNIDSFFPRAYDLSVDEEVNSFVQDFRGCCAMTVLNKWIRLHQQGAEQQPPPSLLCALSVCWHLLVQNQALSLDANEMVDGVASPRLRLTRPASPLLESISDLPIMTEEEWLIISTEASTTSQADTGVSPISLPDRSKKDRSAHQLAVQVAADVRHRFRESLAEKPLSALCAEAAALLQRCGEQPGFQMSLLNESNGWIVKPAGKSRGRGIRCFSNLAQLLLYTHGGVEPPLQPGEKREAPDQWVVQKYIERPLLIRNKKFDVRQWVLVTSMKPLTVWFYSNSYLRFAGTDFSMSNLEDQFAHLCNNSVQKHSENFVVAEEGMEGWMWTHEQFITHFESERPDVGTVWHEKVVPAMQEQVVSALICASEEVASRKNSFEMFGYDFMMDENFNTWLIEVNSSPDIGHTTDVTAKLCGAMVSDMLEVILPEERKKPKPAEEQAEVKSEEHAEPTQGGPAEEASVPVGKKTVGAMVGGWELIHRGAVVPASAALFGEGFELVGTKLEKQKKKGTKKKAHNPVQA